MNVDLPDDWREALAPALASPGFAQLAAFVDGERRKGPVYPPENDVFAAFRATPFERTKVVLLGQDPYHGAGQAHGLAFSVNPGVKLPPSLRNVFRELATDLGVGVPKSGCLLPWAERGVLLLNTVLTVAEAKPGSHAKHGWEELTDAALDAIARRARPSVWLLWGAPAKKKARLAREHQRVIEGVHPSPLSAASGFFGSKPFSAVNAALRELGEEPIDWAL